MSKKKAKELNLEPLGTLKAFAFSGADPRSAWKAASVAATMALKKAGLTLGQIDLIELHEAFAAQYLSCEKELGLNREIVNVNGSGIALGHPIGNTGCRIVVGLIHEMEKRGLKLGLAALCGGGRHGQAIIIERI